MREEYKNHLLEYIDSCLEVIKRTKILSEEEIQELEALKKDSNNMITLMFIDQIVNTYKNVALAWEEKEKEQ
jgi:hypothetical protein